MTSLAPFVATQLSLALFGIAFVFHPAVRRSGWLARVSLAFLAGAIMLTADATLLSLVRLSWGERTLPIPVALLSIVLIRRWWRQPVDEESAETREVHYGVVAAFSAPLAAAILYLVMNAWYGVMPSTDFLLFWSTKAAHFAAARGLDPQFLRSPYSIHTHVNYPQLFPMTLVWSNLLTGDAMFRYGVLTAPIWFVMALPLMFALLRERMTVEQSLATLALWSLALSSALVDAFCGGNAEPPLIAYTTVALIALLVDHFRAAPSALARLSATVALAGMMMTKVEGSVAAAFLIVGWIVRERRDNALLARLLRMFVPAFAVASTWWLYEIVYRTPLTDPVREGMLELNFSFIPQMLRAVLVNAQAGTFWLSWILPLLFLLSGARRWRTIAPALLLSCGTLAFLLFYYLHARGNPELLVRWTFPRVSLTALSALVIGAAFVHFSTRPKTVTTVTA